MKLSFCTTCKGRLQHLRRTLPVNLAVARDFDVEFVVLDYNCQNHTYRWVADRIRDPRVRAYKTSIPVYYDSSHAKNIAHRLARGEILFSLDADNMLTPETIQFILDCFEKDPATILRGDGSHGRYGQVALKARVFNYMQGYDEQLPPGWGADDEDIVDRGIKFGLKLKYIPKHLTRIIRHPDEMRMDNFPIKNWRLSNAIKNAARKNKVFANTGKSWGYTSDLMPKYVLDSKNGLVLKNGGISHLG